MVIFHLLPKTRGLWAFVYSLTPHCYIDLPAAWQAAIIDFEITFQPWICVPLLDHAINHLENSHGCWCDHSRCSHFNVINDGPLVCATYMYHNLPASPYCWIFKRQEIKGRASSPSKNKMDDLGVAFFKKSHSYHVDIARIIPCLRIVRRLSEQNNLQASFRTPPEKKALAANHIFPIQVLSFWAPIYWAIFEKTARYFSSDYSGGWKYYYQEGTAPWFLTLTSQYHLVISHSHGNHGP